MKRVYQTIIEKNIGNCMQSAFASLFDMELDNVPYKNGDGWFKVYYEFIHNLGYDFLGTIYNINDYKIRGEYHQSYKEHYNKMMDKNITNELESLKDYKGVNGLFFASVYSPKYVNIKDKHPSRHAVIIDDKFNIIHDPNPNYKNIKKYPYSDELGYNGVIDVFLIQKKSD